MTNDLDTVFEAFESAWTRDETPDLSKYLPPVGGLQRREALLELIRIDLEFRWRGTRAEAGDGTRKPWTLQDYAAAYPELTVAEMVSSGLAAEEYRARARWGDRPDLVEFASGFDVDTDCILPQLQAIDAELNDEQTLAPEGFVLEETINTPNRKEQKTEADLKEQRSDAPGSQKERFGDYELLFEIARGGMGVVYQARQRKLNRIVALKMIRSGELADDDEVQRFQAEAEAAAQLDHPGIVPIYEVGEQDGQHFFSMGFVEGAGLDAKLKDGPLSPKEAAELIGTIAAAVQFAHDKGIVHRDLKPANVLIDTEGQPRITDFGLAKNIVADSGMTATGQVMGTPSYMPPEQAAGRIDEIGPAADVYSLGALLYAALTGRPPFQSASVMETLKQVLEREPIAPRQLNPAVDKDLETICLKCLEKEAGKRYATARAFADDLGRYLAGKPIAARPIGRIDKTYRWCKRNPMGATVVGLLFILATGGPLMAMRQSELAENATEQRNLAIQSQAAAETQAGLAITASRRADRARDRAEHSEQNAKQSQATAETQAGLAIAASQRADRAARKALTAQKQEAEERLRAESALYVSDARLAAAKVKDGAHAAGLERLLNHFPMPKQRDPRGWEWYYLLNQADQSELTWQAGASRIATIAWSPDGKHLATVHHDDPGAQIWDAKTGRLIRSFPHGNTIKYGVAWSPDGKQLAWGCATNPALLRVWDAKTDRVVELPTASGSIRSVKWSPKGNKIAVTSIRVASAPGKTMVFILKQGRWRLMSARASEAGPDCGVDWNFDGSMLAFAGGSVRVINPRTTKTIYYLKRTRYWNDCDWSPKKNLLAVVGDNECVVLDVEKRRELARFHAGPVRNVEWSPDGRYVATTGLDGLAKIWKTDDWSLVSSFAGHDGAVSSVTWHPDSRKIATCGYDGRINIWPVRNDSDRPLIKQLASNQRFVWTREGLIQTYVKGSGVVDFHPVSGKIVHQHKMPNATNWRYLGANLLWRPRSGMGTKRLYEFVNVASNLRADREIQKLRQIHGKRDGASYVYTTHRDHRFVDPILVDAASGAETKLGRGWLGVRGVEWSPDGNTVVAYGSGYRDQDGTLAYLGWLHLFDAKSGRALKRTRVGVDRFEASSCDWSPDGHHIAAGTDDGVCEVFDARTFRKLTSRRIHTVRTTAMSWHPTENRIATSSKDRTIAIWDTSSGEVLLRFHVDSDVHQVEWSPDGKMLAARIGNGEYRVWDATGGYKLARSKHFETRFNDRLQARFRSNLFAQNLEIARRLGIELLDRRDKNPYVAYYSVALLCAAADNAEVYSRTCQRMVAQFRSSTVPVERYFTARTCVLAPAAVTDYSKLVALAEATAKGRPADVSHRELLGAVLFRAGRFDEALKHLQAVTAGNSTFDAWYFLAMAEHRLGKKAQAGRSLTKANRLAKQELSKLTGPRGTYRRLTADLLSKEATSLIRGPHTPASAAMPQ